MSQRRSGCPEDRVAEEFLNERIRRGFSVSMRWSAGLFLDSLRHQLPQSQLLIHGIRKSPKQ
jgi:hypothetical protein